MIKNIGGFRIENRPEIEPRLITKVERITEVNKVSRNKKENNIFLDTVEYYDPIDDLYDDEMLGWIA